MNNKFCKYINKCHLVEKKQCISIEARNEEACFKYWEYEKLKHREEDVESKK